MEGDLMESACQHDETGKAFTERVHMWNKELLTSCI